MTIAEQMHELANKLLGISGKDPRRGGYVFILPVGAAVDLVGELFKRRTYPAITRFGDPCGQGAPFIQSGDWFEFEGIPCQARSDANRIYLMPKENVTQDG